VILKTASIGPDRQALVLDSECLRELGATETDEFEVTRNGDVIELRPVSHDSKTQIRAMAELVMKEHDDTFRKLSQ
jgi:hypothetical protein